jgi:hypothetical protein
MRLRYNAVCSKTSVLRVSRLVFFVIIKQCGFQLLIEE